MKILLALLATINISSIGFSSINNSLKTDDIKMNNSTKQMDENIKKEELNQSLFFDPTYPSFTVTPIDSSTISRIQLYRFWQHQLNSEGTYDFGMEISNSNQGTWYGKSRVITSNLDLLKYANNESDFKSKYDVYLNFKLAYDKTDESSWPYGGGNNYSGEWKDNSIKLSFNVNKRELLASSGASNKVSYKIRSSYTLQIANNRLSLSVLMEDMISGYTNSSVWHHSVFGGYRFQSIEFRTKFNIETDLNQKLKNNFANKFKFISSTDSNINSDSIESIDPKFDGRSNKRIIQDEIKRRFKVVMGITYDEWFGGSHPILAQNLMFDDKNKQIKITLKTQSGATSGQQKVLKDIVMPVEMKLNEYFWQKSLKKRLIIKTGLTVNPVETTAELINDNPEFLKDGNIEVYIYHNTISLSFGATEKSDEMMTINGKKVEVLDNQFNATLSDGRNYSSSQNTFLSQRDSKGDFNYEMKITGHSEIGDIENLVINFRINSLASKIDFTWLGWDPKNDPNLTMNYNQWLLTQPMVNDKKNPLYDSTIDAKTGTRKQNIFVKTPKAPVDPFAIDPLDKMGNIVSKENGNLENYMFGYIAEATVVNKGVETTFDDLEKVALIQRVQIDENDFSEIGSRETLKTDGSEPQFSKQGLWHYIIYLKDYVKTHVDPTNANDKEVKAEKGSAIHKFLLISNKNDSYQNFLDQPVIKNHAEYVTNFLSSSTIPGFHLKNFLTQYKQFKTSDIEKLTYEDIIKYWKEFVSAQKEQIIDVPQEPVSVFDLSDVYFTQFMINSTIWKESEKRQKAIEAIFAHVKEVIIKYQPDLEFDRDRPVDYKILDENNIDLSKIDFKDFFDINDAVPYKQIKLNILPTDATNKLTGSNKITITNNANFDASKLLDISKIDWSDRNTEGNFNSWSDEDKKMFSNNYIFENIKKVLKFNNPSFDKKNNTVEWEYDYQKDYFIYINGQKADDFDFNKFLNVDIKTTITVTIIASQEPWEVLLSGEGSFILTNDPNSKYIPPLVPPDPTLPDGENSQNQGDTQKKILAIVLGIITALLLSTGLILFIVYKRRKGKKIKK